MCASTFSKFPLNFHSQANLVSSTQQYSFELHQVQIISWKDYRICSLSWTNCCGFIEIMIAQRDHIQSMKWMEIFELNSYKSSINVEHTLMRTWNFNFVIIFKLPKIFYSTIAIVYERLLSSSGNRFTAFYGSPSI